MGFYFRWVSMVKYDCEQVVLVRALGLHLLRLCHHLDLIPASHDQGVAVKNFFFFSFFFFLLFAIK